MKRSTITKLTHGQQRMRAMRGPGVLVTVNSRGTGYRAIAISENQTTTSGGSKAPRWQ
jgi:hypothetical protein